MAEETEKLPVREQAVSIIKTIYDPEIPVNIYELGLVYDITVNNEKIDVLMTLTAPNCPAAESLPAEVETKLKEIEGISEVDVEITFDPPWTQELMTEEAKLELGLL